jgi:hypothetical protein
VKLTPTVMVRSLKKSFSLVLPAAVQAAEEQVVGDLSAQAAAKKRLLKKDRQKLPRQKQQILLMSKPGLVRLLNNRKHPRWRAGCPNEPPTQ